MSGNFPAWREQCRKIGDAVPERLPFCVTGGLSLAVAGLGVWLCAGLIAPIFAVQKPLPVFFFERDPGEMALRLNRIPIFSMAVKEGGGQVNNQNGIELLGVVSPQEAIARPRRSSGGGWAVLRIEGEEGRLVMAGEELQPGLRLLQVNPEGIILERAASHSQFEIALRREAGSPLLERPSVTADHSVEVRKVIETNDM